MFCATTRMWSVWVSWASKNPFSTRVLLKWGGLVGAAHGGAESCFGRVLKTSRLKAVYLRQMKVPPQLMAQTIASEVRMCGHVR